ncbi:MAG: hypothetical protein JXR07_20565 [Reichenbachiella sp.]
MDLQELLNVDGGDNNAGLAINIYIARASTVLTWPTVTANPTTFAERVTITDPVVFKTDGRFYKVQCIVEKNGLQSLAQGEVGSKSTENILTFRRKGITKESLGLFEEFKNDDLVVVVPDLEGDHRILGTVDLPATLSEFEASTGEAVADHKHSMFKIRSVGAAAPFYEGAISETPAV